MSGWDEVEIALNSLNSGSSGRAAEAIEPGHVLLIGSDAIFGRSVVDAEDDQFVKLTIVGYGVVVAIGRDTVGNFTGVDQAILVAIKFAYFTAVDLAIVVAVTLRQLALIGD